jgi:hypothetical protein
MLRDLDVAVGDATGGCGEQAQPQPPEFPGPCRPSRASICIQAVSSQAITTSSHRHHKIASGVPRRCTVLTHQARGRVDRVSRLLLTSARGRQQNPAR